MKCGLLGRKLGHSYSPQIHAYLGDYPYVLYEKEPDALEDFLKSGDFTGINVTIPYKKEVIPFLDELSDVARKMGAVNTIVRRSDGSLYGHNTDYFGFSSMVSHSGLQVTGKKVLVLGSGGASNTASAVLKELGACVTVISRSGENSYNNLHLHSDASIIVNATPVGMYPNNGQSPVDLDLFPKLEGVLDLIYNPARTQLILDAEKRNLVAENGLWMLAAQAKEAAEYFTGNSIEDSLIAHIHTELSGKMQNIVLIGMPGCGKSTVGKALADICSKEFVDADQEIIRLAGKSIPSIFAEDGEEIFRQWETKVLELLGKRSGLVIATGGGCVTRPENYPLLHQNSSIVWLKRDLSLLPTEGRPLSHREHLKEMYDYRAPMYGQFADITVENSHSPQQTAALILTALEE